MACSLRMASVAATTKVALLPSRTMVPLWLQLYRDRSRSLDIGVARLLADGSYDAAFSGDGIVQVAPGFIGDHVTCVVLQADGKILVGGYSFCVEGNSFAFIRFMSDGILDPDFGVNGMVTTEFTGGYTLEATAIALREDGKILLAGGGASGSPVVRYLADGTVDTAFRIDGPATCAFGGGNDRANGMAMLEDGRILFYGHSANNEVDPVR